MTLLKRLLALYCAEASLTVLWIFFTPSEGRSAVILWLSRERLVLLSGRLADMGPANSRRNCSVAFAGYCGGREEQA